MTGSEPSLFDLAVIGLASEVGKYTFLQLAEGASKLWNSVKSATHPTCRHEEFAERLKEKPEEVAAEIEAAAANDKEFKQELTRLVNDVHVKVSNKNTQGSTTVGKAEKVYIQNNYFFMNSTDSTDQISEILRKLERRD